jgi:acetoacetyl-CoA synthetase
VYRDIKKDVQLSSISGGTDIISCFMLGCPVLPVFSGELQCRGLGMKVETFNEQGKQVADEIGELVCTAPFPSRPVYFWNDDDGSKYKKAYFSHYKNVWRHGDYIKINERGGCIVYGRSDATLNPGGVRIGTAEIYAPVETLPEIEESIVIGKKDNGDTRIILFVVLHDGYTLTDSLKKKINDTLRKNRSPRHVPSEIFAINEVPHTLNGKKVEIAVTKVIHGEKVSNLEALANPDSLKQFEHLNI